MGNVMTICKKLTLDFLYDTPGIHVFIEYLESNRELPGSDTGERHILFHLITVFKVPILFIDFLYLSRIRKKINTAIQHAP